MNTKTSQTPEHRPINLEQALAILACALALALRFLNLGAAPLSDAEARWALQSLTLANSSHAAGPLIYLEVRIFWRVSGQRWRVGHWCWYRCSSGAS
jgi:hypothetical protein